MLLRPGTVEDAARVANILISVRAQFMPYAPSAHSADEVREWVRTRLIPMGGVTVAEDKGEVVGLVAESIDGEFHWIEQMSVCPSRVGQGIGSELLGSVLNGAILPIRLYTFQDNVGARRFYERHGFKAIEFTDGQGNEEHCPDVLYENRLSPMPQH